jgi:urease subunit alpha
VLKGGFPVWGALGEGNATVEGAEPTRYRAHWGGAGVVAADTSVQFCAPGSAKSVARVTGTQRPLVEIGRTRGLTRDDLMLNRAVAPIDVDPVDGTVTLDGRVLAAQPVAELPLNRRYFLR